MTGSGNDREARAARNQSLFRDGNERLRKFNEDWLGTVPPKGSWLCECANDTCVEHIEMATGEYEAVRLRGDHFFVAPGDEHVWPDIELVIERHDRYWVVEKTGRAKDLTLLSDPRSKT
jgi:hypothetical protein